MKWLTAEEVAGKIRVSTRHFRERYCFRPGFPVAMRPAGGRPLWREDEIDD